MKTVPLNSAPGRWVMISTILASAMAFIDMTGLNVALPSLQKALDAKGSDLFWILNGYLLMVASLILVGGAFGDKIGRKIIFMTGISIFLAGSALCGFAQSTAMLIGFRILQGLGGAMMVPGSLSLISSSINSDQRGKAIGIWSAFSTIFTMGGPMLGGALADAGLWRYIFFINIPIGLTALLMLTYKVSENKADGDEKIDFAGAGAVGAGLALLTFGFLRIPDAGMHDISVIITLSSGIALLIIFILIEKYSRHPMMPLNLFSNATFSGANLLTFFLYAGLGISTLFLSLNLVQVQGYSQFHSGLTFLPFTIMMAAASSYIGNLSDKYGPRWFLIIGPVITGAGQILLSSTGQTRGASQYFSTFFPGILLLGVGMTIVVSPLTATVMSAADNRFTGVASGINNAMTNISRVIANAIFGAFAILLFSNALEQQLAQVPIDVQTKHLVIAQASNLGNAKVPAGLTQHQTAIKKIYHQSFITVYAIIMRICAGLSFIAALMTVFFIRNHTTGIKKD